MKIDNFFKNTLKNIRQALFPEDITCVNCGKELVAKTRYNFCAECMLKLPYVGRHRCEICGAELNNEANLCIGCMNNDHFYDLNRSPLKYEGIAQNLIKKLKFKNKRYISRELAKLLVDEYISAGYNCDIVTAVPMGQKEIVERGFNQSSLLAKEVAEKLKLPFTNCLIKVRDTSDQKHLKGRERRENLKGVFCVNDNTEIKSKNVLIIDDVFTTGATINECSRTLKRASARGVYSLTVCITQFKLSGETSEK